MTIRGGRVGSIQRFKQKVTRNSNKNFIRRLKADEPLVVRFLTEPEEWIEYFEYYDADDRQYRAVGADQYLEDDVRVSRRFAAVVLDVADDTTFVIQIPVTLAETLNLRYERYGSLMDRDYELSRMGKDLNTKYDALPEAVSNRKLDKYFPLPEVAEMLAATVKGAEPVTTPAASNGNGNGNSTAVTPTGRKAVVEEPVAEDDVLLDDTDSEDELDQQSLLKLTRDQLIDLAKQNGVAVKGKTKADVVAAIIAAVNDDDDEEDDDEPF